MNIKNYIFIVICFFFPFTVTQADQEKSFEYGAWKIVSNLECEEEHYFDGESRYRVKSGSQILNKGYLISKVDNSVYWQIRSTVIENNGKPDCLGDIDSEVGSELVLYIKLNESKDEMRFYFLPDESSYLNLYLKKTLK